MQATRAVCLAPHGPGEEKRLNRLYWNHVSKNRLHGEEVEPAEAGDGPLEALDDPLAKGFARADVLQDGPEGLGDLACTVGESLRGNQIALRQGSQRIGFWGRPMSRLW